MKITTLALAGLLGITSIGFVGIRAHAEDYSKTGAPAPAADAATQMVEFPIDVKFDTGKAVVLASKSNDAEFERLKTEMSNYPYAKVEIEGYADSTGPEAMNQKLSEKRAMAVREQVIKKTGIAPNRISVVGHGEVKPLATNDTASGRSENRRVIARIYRLEPNMNEPSTKNRNL